MWFAFLVGIRYAALWGNYAQGHEIDLLNEHSMTRDCHPVI